MKKKIMVTLLSILCMSGISKGQDSCKNSGTPDSELDCQRSEDRLKLVMNHCLSEEAFRKMVPDSTYFRAVTRKDIRKITGTRIFRFRKSCNAYKLRLKHTSTDPKEYIQIELATIPKQFYAGSYNLGLFRGIFRKYKHVRQLQFYLGTKPSNIKESFPFKVIYYQSGKEYTAYYDFSQEDPDKQK